ncbi:hypothetical protein ACWOAH_01075 [Vagococcus vulneris]|uniref:Lipoprotein n=1 Tax=Vagococcus vulneris TaxID=1977869 RepID=A0A430A251_9ENTE|nr:hypothetical protein [Vagococcus vulneris]RSU00521.1 hypothetical protein CBF37_00465 [Vagococcus vulneris]
MKKIRLIIVAFVGIILLAGCSQKIDKESLTKNDWTAYENENGEEVPVVISFKNNKLTIKNDTDTNMVQSSNKDNLDDLSDELAKTLRDSTIVQSNYKIEKDELVLKNSELGFKKRFKLSREKDNIILTPTDGDNKEPFVLKPKK